MVSEAKAIPIVTQNSDHTITLDEKALSDILKRPDVTNKQVFVVSVAGAFRTGKSFLLNFLLRFLVSNRRSSHKDDHQEFLLGDEAQPLIGFDWHCGIDPVTTGILMWNEPFFRKLPNGDEVVVLIIDTQGSFGPETTTDNCAKIFALSTMISSIQIFNLSQRINEYDLQHLQLFTDYGRLALEQSKSNLKPFQSLVFLVRDWATLCNFPHGLNGGNDYLKKIMADNRCQENKVVREQIVHCFESTECFLMPSPGTTVIEDPGFDGSLSKIEERFKKHLTDLFLTILSPVRLVPKEDNGLKITADGLLKHFKAYAKIFQGNTLPSIQDIFSANAEASHDSAREMAILSYMTLMKEKCGEGLPYLESSVDNESSALSILHASIKKRVVQQFQDAHKIGSDSVSAKYEKQLSDNIQKAFENLSLQNERKKHDFLVIVDRNNTKAVADAKELYMKQMDEERGKQHARIKSDAVKFFSSIQKGNPEKVGQYLTQMAKKTEEEHLKKLLENLNNEFESYENKNSDICNDYLKTAGAGGIIGAVGAVGAAYVIGSGVAVSEGAVAAVKKGAAVAVEKAAAAVGNMIKEKVTDEMLQNVGIGAGLLATVLSTPLGK